METTKDLYANAPVEYTDSHDPVFLPYISNRSYFLNHKNENSSKECTLPMTTQLV